MLSAALLPAFALPALAAPSVSGNDFAQKGADWILSGLFWVVVVGGLIGVGTAAVKRNLTGALIILVATGVAGFIILNPDIITSLGAKLGGILGLGS